MTNFVLTEEHLLIFYDPNRNNALSSRLVQMMPQFELLLTLELDNMKYEINDDNFILIVNDEKINCYNFDVCKFVNKNL